jgi:hypothetical protein
MITTSLTNNNLTIIIDNENAESETYSVNSSHPKWSEILEATRTKNKELILKLLDTAGSILKYSNGDITIDKGNLFYKGVQIGGVVVDRILDFHSKNLPFETIVRFLKKLLNNPSKKAKYELYKFLEHKNMPLTPDGNFLAYKGLTNEYWSIHSGNLTMISGKVNERGQIFNGIGEEIECERNQVCDDRNVGCSTGIHAGSLSYAKNFAGSGKIVIVEINPSDVVSVPIDCEHQKLRTCKYKVIAEFERALDDTYTSDYSSPLSDEDYDEDYDEDEDYDDESYDDDDGIID